MADNLRDRIIATLDIEDFYKNAESLELIDTAGGQWSAVCPFHEDNAPSLNIRSKDGVFNCFSASCGATGSVFDFYMKRHNVDFKTALKRIGERSGAVPAEADPEPLIEESMLKWHETLLKFPNRMKWLREKRGLSDETIRKVQLGWDGERYTIPIRDGDGNLVNVRRYLPNAPTLKGKMLGIAGHNERRLMFTDFQKGETIVLTEGELDCLLARQYDILATTVTSGAGIWDSKWNTLFRGKRVVIAYDNDETGRRGASRVARQISSAPANVYILQWPEGFRDKGDVTDWFIEDARSVADFTDLVEKAAPYDTVGRPESEGAVSIYPLTDLGNAERLAERYHEDIRHVDSWNKWLVWDGVIWRVDDERRIVSYASTTVRTIKDEALGAEDDKDRIAITKHAVVSENERRITALISLARPKMALRTEDMNHNPSLVVTPNGVLDLRDAEPATVVHDKALYLTQMTKVPFNPAARSEVWERFLLECVQGDKDLLHFVHKAIGYSLTGDTTEEVMFFVYGPTATGKSTFLEAIKAAFGDYAATVDVEAFLSKKFGGGGPSPELAKLRWKRMVVSVEVEEGKHLAESLIKLVTGGDEISVRGLYREPETFKPTFKIWIAANNRPKVSDVDDAIWRRIIVLPFTNSVPTDRRDKTLKARLCSVESEAVLAWVVRGTVLWRKEGLGRPTAVMQKALDEYKTEMDPLADWLAERTSNKNAEAATPQSNLFRSYTEWAKGRGIRFPMGEAVFGIRLTAHGFTPDVSNGIKVRKGILIVGDGGEAVQGEKF